MILSLLSVVQRSAPLHTRTLGLTWNKIQQTETKKTTFDSTFGKKLKIVKNGKNLKCPLDQGQPSGSELCDRDQVRSQGGL